MHTAARTEHLTLIEGNTGFGFLALNSTPEAQYEAQPVHEKLCGLVLLSDARVDNRMELISRLGIRPWNEQPVTDADIILAAYRKWHTDAPNHIIGDFAFVIFDPSKREIFAARDPMGIRSLNYALFGSSFCIASEAKQILQHPKATIELNEMALVEVFR